MSLNKVKIPLLETAKWLSFLIVLVFLVSLVSQGKRSNTEFSVMSEAVISAAVLDDMVEADNQMVKRLYGLDSANYEGLMLYTPTTNMGAEEILLVKLSDTAQQEEIKAAAEKRIATQMDSFEGYGITQYEMLEAHVLEIQGNYILLVVAADPAPVRQAFLGAL